jgi:hypothetical protein
MTHSPSFRRRGGSDETPAVTGRIDNANKARAVSINGMSGESMGRTSVLTNSYLIRNSFFDKLITDENLQEFLTLVATTI